MIKIYIPGLPCKSYEYRRGDAQIIHDDEKNAIVIDGGEPDLCNKIIAYCRNFGISHVTYILTHWHLDHDAGMKQLLDSSLIVDKIYCPPPSELRGLQESGANEDYSRALRRIAQAEKLHKEIVYPTAGVDTMIVVGKIRCRIWRRKATASDKNDYEINNTSLCTYFPDLYYLTTGDTINSFDIYLSGHHDQVRVFKIPHHGNACTTNPCEKLQSYGAKLCWYNDWEKKGSSVGSSSFSKWGAGYTKKYFVTLRTDADISMTAQDKKLLVQYGSNKYTYDIPFDDAPGVDHWVHGEKGWWYEYADGSYAIGWKYLPWSQGQNWFYFNKDGWMCTGWIYDGGCWYYCDPKTGAMVTGWQKLKWSEGEDWFYFEPVAGQNQGHAYQDCTETIDGKTYYFDHNCVAHEVTDAKKNSKSTLNVIDIASYQSFLDLTKMNGSGLDGVIIKATQGTTYLNPCLYKHYYQAREAGLLIGLYHYANGTNAASEAEYFVSMARQYLKNKDVLLALDWEGNQNKAFGKNDVTYCLTFLDHVYKLTGIRPLIYMSKSVCRAHDWPTVSRKYALWAAQYANTNETGWKTDPWTDKRGYGAWSSPAIYQYSSNGRLSGYGGRLDLDIAYMDREGWLKFAKPNK